MLIGRTARDLTQEELEAYRQSLYKLQEAKQAQREQRAGWALALAVRIRARLADIARVSERVHELASKAETRGDDDYWDGVALNLYGFYVGVERCLEDIAREVDESVPGGPRADRDLLLQMAVSLSGRRPAVVSRSCRQCLEAYRAFRHLVSDDDPVCLRRQWLDDLVQALPGCFEELKGDLGAFVSFLEGVS